MQLVFIFEANRPEEHPAPRFDIVDHVGAVPRRIVDPLVSDPGVGIPLPVEEYLQVALPFEHLAVVQIVARLESYQALQEIRIERGSTLDLHLADLPFLLAVEFYIDVKSIFSVDEQLFADDLRVSVALAAVEVDHRSQVAVEKSTAEALPLLDAHSAAQLLTLERLIRPVDEADLFHLLAVRLAHRNLALQQLRTSGGRTHQQQEDEYADTSTHLEILFQTDAQAVAVVLALRRAGDGKV